MSKTESGKETPAHSGLRDAKPLSPYHATLTPALVAVLAHSSFGADHDMLPLFSDNDTRRKRQINLGGASSAASHSSIIDQAKARRHERDEQRRRSESALRIQAWWRGANATRIVRAQLREHFQANLRNLTGLRCLALLGQDEEALGAWSTAVTGNSAGA